MNKSAILHIPLSQYAFATSEHSLTIRIRTGKNDLTACTLYYGDRACNCTPVRFSPLPMRNIGEDSLYTYYEVNVESTYNRICYYFKLEKDDEWYYYYADQFTRKLADVTIDNHIIEGRSEYYQYPVILREEILDVPEWFKNAIVYNIFPDSFASGKRALSGKPKLLEIEVRADGQEGLESSMVTDTYQTTSKSRLGGTIQGIIENLDYIQELGFTCIYLNPIFVAGESHKYDILDYYHIDPCFGTDEDFHNLVDEIHRRDMRIIIDGVFNHCSWYFFAFDDVVKNGEKSRYKDWFYELDFPVIRPEDEKELPNYSCFAYERKMPKLNTSNVEVQEYFAKVCTYWLKEFKVDGWRLDVANEIDRNFWHKFRQAAKEANPQSVLIGEVWENSLSWLRGDTFDSTMNYDFRKHCREFFALREINGKQFKECMQQMYLRYPKNISLGQLNLLDSHDVPRFLSLCNGDLRRYQLALVFLLMFPGVPSVFYGDEKGIEGIKENEYRQAMPWSKIEGIEELVKELISIRKKYLQAGDAFGFTKVDKEDVICLERITNKGRLLVWLNGSLEKISIKSDISKDSVLLTNSFTLSELDPNSFVIMFASK
ncbi:glycoside hydrolase family 13 protein [Anaerosporobacter sp.]